MTGETPPAAGQDLLAVCEVCLQLIADGDGAVWCRPETAAGPGDRDDGTALTLTELLDRPDTRARWRVTHEDCEPAAGYQIAVERIRTWPAYLHWTPHLMGKGWFADTNWDDLILDTPRPDQYPAGDPAGRGARPRPPQRRRLTGDIGLARSPIASQRVDGRRGVGTAGREPPLVCWPGSCEPRRNGSTPTPSPNIPVKVPSGSRSHTLEEHTVAGVPPRGAWDRALKEPLR